MVSLETSPVWTLQSNPYLGLLREERPIKSVCVCVSMYSKLMCQDGTSTMDHTLLNTYPKGNYLDPESVMRMTYQSTSGSIFGHPRIDVAIP